MNCWSIRILLTIALLLVAVQRSPAPLVYTPGEGWNYEPVGSEGKWRRTRAKDQMELAQQAYDRKDFSLATKSAQFLVRQWPLSDYAPEAEYLLGRCYEAKKNDEKAFKAYEVILEKYPRSPRCDEILQRQYEIAGRFLAGQRWRLWGLFPLFRSMDKTVELYEKIVKAGPYSDVAPKSQMNIGEARMRQKEYLQAAKAYEMAADRYSDRPKYAADAYYKTGIAYNKQSLRAEYDQNTANMAISTFSDFAVLYPDDSRTKETQTMIESLRLEKSRGAYEIARWYEKHSKLDAAMIYYNECVSQAANSPQAKDALKRIDRIKQRQEKNSAKNAAK
jgi:outer membrane protein assembly factor BamD